MPIAYRTRPVTIPVPEEEVLERRLARDRGVHAAMKARRHRKTVAREFGISTEEVDAIVKGIDASLKAVAAAAPKPPAEPAKWPPARIRNVLVRQFGIPPDRTDDAALLSEVLGRRDLLDANYVNVGTVNAVAAFLASKGFSLRD